MRGRIFRRLSSLLFVLLLSTSALGALRRGEISEAYYLPPDGKVKIAFLDADWTVRTSRSGATTAVRRHDVVILPFVAEKIRELNDEGYLVAIISNQGWAPDTIKIDTVESALSYTVTLLKGQGATANYFDFAEAGSDKQKPGVGMATGLVDELERRFGPGGFVIDWENSFMVGDAAYKSPARKSVPLLWPAPGQRATNFSDSDKRFAENLGIRFLESRDYFGWRRFGVDTFVNSHEVNAFWRARPKCREALRMLATPSSSSLRTEGEAISLRDRD